MDFVTVVFIVAVVAMAIFLGWLKYLRDNRSDDVPDLTLHREEDSDKIELDERKGKE